MSSTKDDLIGYQLRKIDVLSAAKFGFAVGMITSVLPTLLSVLVAAWVAAGLQDLLGNLAKVKISPVGDNFLKMLSLEGLLTSVEGFNQAGIYILLFLGSVLAAGLLCAGLGALVALAYNRMSAWTGGLVMTLASIPTEVGTPSPSVGQVPPVIPQPQTLSVGGAGPAPVLPSALGRPVAPLPAQSPAAPQPLPGYMPAVAQPPPAYAPATIPPPEMPRTTRPMPGAPSSPPPTPAGSPPPEPASGISPVPTVSGPRLALAANPNQVWLINKPVFIIGSAPGSDLYATGLAPQHARIEFDQANRAYVLYDVSNGQTRVNNRPVQGKNKLNNGFQVQVGTINLVFYV